MYFTRAQICDKVLVHCADYWCTHSANDGEGKFSAAGDDAAIALEIDPMRLSSNERVQTIHPWVLYHCFRHF